MNIAEAQKDLRRAYVGGGPGVLISGLVWALAGVAETLRGAQFGFAVLFMGGMLIFPLSALVVRSFLGREKPRPGNGLGSVALECTIAMIGGLFAASLFLSVKSSLVFPLAAIAVGTHYAAFRTAYGDRIFLFLAALITCVGVIGIYVRLVEQSSIIFGVAVTELVFGVILTFRAMRAE